MQTFLSLVALTATTVSAQAGLFFIQDTGAPIVIDRVDPVLLPGAIPGNHVHSIVGSNAFSANVTYEDLQAKTTCSTVFVKQDKSVYWLPSLYFQDPKNGSFSRVEERPEHKIYYLNRIGKNETMNEFPKGFKMIAGDATLRSLAPTKQQQQVTQWFCHSPNKVDSGFPKGITGCGYGFAGSIHFPQCWNGEAFDINNPSAHVSYPMGNFPDSGYCPPSHPKALPHIFIEFWFDTKAYDGLYGANDNPWVLSNGDPTGYGFHADFINGWDEGALLKAMTTCTIGESGRPLSECFDMYTPAERKACSIEPQVKDNIDDWVPQLPGCNPIQSGPAAATATPNCDANNKAVAAPAATAAPVASKAGAAASVAAASSQTTYAFSKTTYGTSAPSAAATKAATAPAAADDSAAASGSVENNDAIYSLPAGLSNPTPSPAAAKPAVEMAKPASSSSTPAPVAVASGSKLAILSNWTSLGCYADAVRPARSMNGINLANIGADMTSAGCVQYCSENGYKMAGVEYGTQCFCDNTIVQTSKLDDSVCNMPCKGDGGDMCGGGAALSLYAVKGTKDPTEAAASKKAAGRRALLAKHVRR